MFRMTSQLKTVLAVVSLLLSIAIAQDCTNDTALDIQEAFEKADNVLLGTDVTDLEACQAGGCARRQIQFQVSCVLKQTQELNSFDFTKPISIGEDRIINPCDRTYFALGQLQNMLVMVTVKKDSSNRNYLDWHETNNATRAHYIYGRTLESSLEMSCSDTTFTKPFNNDEDSCGIGRQDCCLKRCMTEDGPGYGMRVLFSSDESYTLGVHCCKKLRARSGTKWLRNAYNDDNKVEAQLLNAAMEEVNSTLMIGLAEDYQLENDEKLALAVVITNQDSDIEQMAWFINDVRLSATPDENHYSVLLDNANTIVDKHMINPKKDTQVEFIFMKYMESFDRNSVLSVQSACTETDATFNIICAYNIKEMKEDLGLQQIASLKAVVTPDDWSVWMAMKRYGATARSACPLIINNVVPYRDTILCPVPLTNEPSLAVTTAPSCVLLIFTLAAILFSLK